MAKKTGKIITGVAAVLVVGAGGAWYAITDAIVKNTSAWVAKAATKKSADGSTTAFSYESITRTSFPSIGVRLVNPSYVFTAPGDAAQNTPPVTFSVKMNGVVDTTTDYIANAYRVKVDGMYAIDATMGEEKLTATSAAPSTQHAMLKARDRATFNIWNALDWNKKEQVSAALKGIAAARYEMGAFTLSDARGGVLLGGEKVALGFVNRSTETDIDGDMMVDIKAVQVSEAYNQMMERMMQATAASALPMKLGDMPFSAARAGKQDVDMAVSVKLPMGLATGAVPNGTIKLSKFYFKNDFYTFNGPMDMALNEVSGQRNFTLKLDWNLETTAAGGAEAQRFVTMIAGFAPPASAESPIDPEALKQKITAALPTLSTLGPIALKIDLDATAPAPAAPAVADAATPAVATGRDSVTLREFTFGHKRWGLEAKGDTLNDANGAQLNLTVVCKQCDTLTGDVFSTAQAAQEVMSLSAPAQQQAALTPELLANINSTLAEIGSKDAAGDIRFALTTPKAGDVAVNGKPIAEVLPKLMAIFMAAQPAPAAIAPLEVPAE